MECTGFLVQRSAALGLWRVSINGQLISNSLKRCFRHDGAVHSRRWFCADGRRPVGMLAGEMTRKWRIVLSARWLLGFSIPVSAGASAHTVLFAHAGVAAGIRAILTCFVELNRLPVSPSLTHGFQIRHGVMRMVMSAIRHMVLPVLTLSVAPTTEVIRLMRISTIEVYDQTTLDSDRALTYRALRFTPSRVCIMRCRRSFPVLVCSFQPWCSGVITEMVFSGTGWDDG